MIISMKYPRLPYEEFMSIYHKVPRAAVDVVVQTEKGIILTKRSIPPFEGMWHIPGGTVLFKEPLEHAIERIAQDELGVKVEIIKLLGVEEFLDDGGRHTITNVFLTQITEGEPRGSEQGEKISFFKETPENCIPEQKDFLNNLGYK